MCADAYTLVCMHALHTCMYACITHLEERVVHAAIIDALNPHHVQLSSHHAMLVHLRCIHEYIYSTHTHTHTHIIDTANPQHVELISTRERESKRKSKRESKRESARKRERARERGRQADRQTDRPRTQNAVHNRKAAPPAAGSDHTGRP